MEKERLNFDPEFKDFQTIIKKISDGKINAETKETPYNLNTEKIILTPKGKNRLFGKDSAMQGILSKLVLEKSDAEDTSSAEALAWRNVRLEQEISELKNKNSELKQESEELAKSKARLAENVLDNLRKLDEKDVQIGKLALEVVRLRSRGYDQSDPKGFYKALGIDPELARSLPGDKFEVLLTSVYKAYSKVHHPDLGGNTEKMALVNKAYDYLKNPLNRNVYGRG